jgi:hypothetical protein
MWTLNGSDRTIGSDLTQTQALEYCRNLSVAGFRDWRLPEIDELQQIYDPSVVSGSFIDHGQSLPLHLRGGIQMTTPYAWSATRGRSSGQAWGFDFCCTLRRFSAGRSGGGGGRALCVRRAGE